MWAAQISADKPCAAAIRLLQKQERYYVQRHLLLTCRALQHPAQQLPA